MADFGALPAEALRLGRAAVGVAVDMAILAGEPGRRLL